LIRGAPLMVRVNCWQSGTPFNRIPCANDVLHFLNQTAKKVGWVVVGERGGQAMERAQAEAAIIDKEPSQMPTAPRSMEEETR
jgi:hypothetical protein